MAWHIATENALVPHKEKKIKCKDFTGGVC